MPRRRPRKGEAGEYKAFGFLDSMPKVGRLIRSFNNLGYSSVEVAELFQEATRNRSIVLDGQLHQLMRRMYVKHPRGVPLTSVLASANRAHGEEELFTGHQIEIILNEVPLTALQSESSGRGLLQVKFTFPLILVESLGKYPLLQPGTKPYGCPRCGRRFRTFCPRDLHWVKCRHF